MDADSAYAAVMSICLYKEKRETGAHTDKYKSFDAMLNDAMAARGEEELNGTQREFVEHVQLKLKSVQFAFAPYMVDIVSNTICADYMDYVRRDTANTGLDRQTDDRVLSQFLVGEYSNADLSTQYRMALLLTDSRGKPRLDACTGVVDLVRKRFRLAEIIYYHKTKVSASAMLAKALSLIGKPPEVPAEPADLIRIADTEKLAARIRAGELTLASLRRRQSATALLSPEIGDESLLVWLQDYAWAKAEELLSADASSSHTTDPTPTPPIELEALLRGIGFLQLLVRRKLYKVCAQISADGVACITGVSGVDGEGNPEQIKQKIQDVMRLRGKTNGQHERRATVERAVAEAADWPLDSVLIYIPPLKSQAKGIETRALSSGSVVTLGEHPAVSGEVQVLNRQYERLWRVILLVHPDFQYDALGLSRAIDAFLGEVWDVDLGKCEADVKGIARFDYIPAHQREGAALFRDLCAPDKPDWGIYLSAANTLRPEATLSSREQASRAYIVSIAKDPPACEKLLKERHSEPGAIEQRVARITRSNTPPVDALRMALKTVGEGLRALPTSDDVSRELSETAFDSHCRAIFRAYVPAEEKGRLRPHYRDFIVRNRSRSGRRRYLLVQHLRKYDLSGIPGLSTQFNREEDALTEAKLTEIERQVDMVEEAA